MSLLQYKGVTISLISRSDIRYIGVLDDINQETSSIALINVKSCGTEGRKGNPFEEIPSQDNIFPYICFRASDVKDLVVEQEIQAPQPPPPATLQDPAIINYSTQRNSQPLRPAHSSQQTLPNQSSDTPGPNPISPNSSISGVSSNIGGTTIASGPPRSSRTAVPPTTGLGSNVAHHRPGPDSTYENHVSSGPSRSNGEQVYHRQTTSNYRDNRYRESNYSSNTYDSRYRTQRHSNGHFPMESNRGGYRPRRYPTDTTTQLVVPSEEFDFETSNAKFHKEDLIKELSDLSLHPSSREVVPELPAKCYDRKASFFDNISCESKERIEKSAQGSNARLDSRKGRGGGGIGGERKLNVQTFGTITVDQVLSTRSHHYYSSHHHQHQPHQHQHHPSGSRTFQHSGHRGGQERNHYASPSYHQRRNHPGPPSNFASSSDHRRS